MPEENPPETNCVVEAAISECKRMGIFDIWRVLPYITPEHIEVAFKSNPPEKVRRDTLQILGNVPVNGVFYGAEDHRVCAFVAYGDGKEPDGSWSADWAPDEEENP